MYYSEYLRNKKLAAPKIVSPPRGRSSGLWTQMQRYRNSRIQGLQSSESVLGAKGNAAICCVETITQPVTLATPCCHPPASYVAVGLDQDIGIKYSEDGVTWHPANGGGGLYGFDVAYGGGTWVAVGGGGSSTIQYSSDGINWNDVSGAQFMFSGYSVAYNGSSWVAVGIDQFSQNILTSPDGKTWASASGSFDQWGLGVAYGGDTWVAVGTSYYDTTIKYSPDGVTWYNATGGFNPADNSFSHNYPGSGFGVAYDGIGTWVAVGVDVSGANIKYSTTGGQSWNDASGSFGLEGVGFDVAYGNNTWVAVGYSDLGNNILHSSDGISWNIANGSFGIPTGGPSGNPGQGYGVSYLNGLWYAVGEDSTDNTILTSLNGINWTPQQTSYFSNSVRAIAYHRSLQIQGKFPRGFYGPPRSCPSDSPPINNGPVIVSSCCVPRVLDNLIVNGSFETGDFTGWTDVSNCILEVQSYALQDFSGPPLPGAPNVAKAGCDVGRDDQLQQSVPTIPGKTYTLSYSLYDDGGSAPIYFSASIDMDIIPDSVIDYLTGPDDPGFYWTQYSFTFVAIQSSTLITFTMQQYPDYFYLTNISLTKD